jgi:predicted Ser/Thr protein kinase
MHTSLQTELRKFMQDDAVREANRLSAGYQGFAYLYTGEAKKLVIKKAGGGILTGWFHQMMLSREARAYEQLDGLAGVAHTYGMLDDKYLVLDFIESRSLKDERRTLQDREQFYATLHEIITGFHAAGVAHGDLKRKDNILVDTYEQPHVIDFGASVRRDGGLFDRLMYPLVARFDFNAWIKVKYDNNYAAISAEDQQWYRPTIVENSVRVLRRFWRTVTFRQARKRSQQNNSED